MQILRYLRIVGTNSLSMVLYGSVQYEDILRYSAHCVKIYNIEWHKTKYPSPE